MASSSYTPDSKSLTEQLTPLLYAFQRYWRMLIGPAAFVFLVGLLLAVKMPDYYTADAVIFIQPQRLASKIIENPSEKEMQAQMEGLIQEILSRPRLRGIIDQYKLYPEISGSGAAQKTIIRLKNSITVEPLKSETGANALQTFQLSFTHNNPQVAYDVARTLSNVFVEESVLAKKTEAQGTKDFFDAKLTEARQDLENTESKIQSFVKENYGKLPEQLHAAGARLQSMQAQLATTTQLLAANQMRRSNLEQELSLARRSAEIAGPSNSDGNAADPNERLAQLQSALVVLRSQYTDKHPDVIRTKARIEALENRLKGGDGKYSVAGDSPNVARVRRDLGEIDVQVKSLAAENERLKNEIVQLDKDIREMPLKEQELSKIKRDYENKKAIYEKLLVGREDAGLQSDLIRSQRAAQFKIVQPAELPTIPAGPMRPLIAGLALVVAIVIFFCVPIAIYFLNDSYKFREEVEDELGVPVIGVIPSIDTVQMASARTKMFAWSLVLSLMAFVGFSAVLIVFV